MTLNISVHNPMSHELKPRITVVGCGGGGGNAVNNMIRSNLTGVEFIIANTDAQALHQSLAEKRIQLGPEITRGLGAGSRPEVGRDAAEEAIEEIMAHLEGTNMVFVTAGMGGGTGTGAAPVIARAAREAGILTVGVVTRPFKFEGERRMRQADQGILELQQYVDTLIVIPNQNLFRMANERTSLQDAFKMADGVLHAGVRGVTDLMMVPGLINLDFADIRTVMGEMGKAMMGTGEATGDRRALEAAEAAISNPLLEDNSMKGARGVLINVTGGPDMTLFEVDEAVNRVQSEVDPDAQIIFGATCDDTLEGVIRVSVVATGIESQAAKEPIHYGDNVIVHEKLRGGAQNRGFATPASPAAVGAMINATAGYTPYAASPTMMSAQPQQQGPATAAYGTVGNTAIAPQVETQMEAAPQAQRMAQPQQRLTPAQQQPNRLPQANRGGLMQDGMARQPAPAARQPVAPRQPAPQQQPMMQQPMTADRPFIAPQPVEAPRQPELSADVAPVQIDPFRQADLENAGRTPAPRAQVQAPAPRQPVAEPVAPQPQAAAAKQSGWGNLLQRMTGIGGRAAAAPTSAEPMLSQPAAQTRAAPAPQLSADVQDRMAPMGQEDDLEIPTFLRRQAN